MQLITDWINPPTSEIEYMNWKMYVYLQDELKWRSCAAWIYEWFKHDKVDWMITDYGLKAVEFWLAKKQRY